MDPRLSWTLGGIGVVLFILSAELPPNMRLLLIAVYGAACYGLYTWRTRPPSKPNLRMQTFTPAPDVKDIEIPNETEIRRIEGLSIEAARVEVERRIQTSRVWTRLELPEEVGYRVKQLTPEQQTFFREYGGLAAIFGQAKLGGDRIKAFKWPATTLLPFGSESEKETGAQKQPFTQVGIDFDENPILAKRNEETIYVVHGTRSSTDKWWCANYPSVFHWILIVEIQLNS